MTDLSKIINEQRDRIAELERQLKEVELDKIDETALVMAGARKIANKSSATSNATCKWWTASRKHLYM